MHRLIGLGESTGAVGRIAGLVGEILKERFELLALELREDKTRFVQLLVLACFVVVFGLLGLILAILAVLFTIPPEWRAAGMGATAVLCFAGVLMTYSAIRKRMRHLPFEQTLAEFKKDKACF